MKRDRLISKSFGIVPVFVMVALVLGGLGWVSESDVAGAGYAEVSVEQPQAMIGSDPDVIALNVSVEKEYEAGPIADTEANGSLSSEIDASLDAGKPVFLFFHADWCHFCQQEMSIIEELELEYAEEIVVIRVDNEDNPQAMTEFGVIAFPTMFLISDESAEGEYRYQEFKGSTDKETLNQSFDWVISYGNVPEGSDAESTGIPEDEPIEYTAFRVVPLQIPWQELPRIPWEDLTPSEVEALCPYCPEPQPGWGYLVGCSRKASRHNCERPYDRTSWVMPRWCAHQFHLYEGPEVSWKGHRLQLPIAPPTSDYCIDEELIMLHRCLGYIRERPCRCPYGCEDGQCICSDTDGGKDYYERGSVRNGTAVVPGTTDYCVETILMQSYTEINPQADECAIRWEEHECPYACRDGTCPGNCYDRIQNQDEQGVDSGGSECPAKCLDCFDDNAFGDAEDAEYLKLGSNKGSHDCAIGLPCPSSETAEGIS